MSFGPFRTIVADPPWQEHGGGGRGAQNHYATLELSEIARAMLSAPCWQPDFDCHLWLWVTDNFLLDGMSLMDQLGFRYVRTMVWVKMVDGEVVWYAGNNPLPLPEYCAARLRIGLGQYLRGSHELCLFGVRGKTMLPERAPPSVVFAPRRGHSRKPREALAAIEQVSPGPRLEMFARSTRDGWTVWGNEC